MYPQPTVIIVEVIPSIIFEDGSSILDIKEEAVELVLPPVDGGRKAWLFLFGAFMIEGILYGFPLTFGVFQQYYEHNSTFPKSPYLSIIGTLAIGVSKLGSPLITPLIIKYPQHRRYMIWSGWLLCTITLLTSSFATQLWHLVVVQGFLFGIGFLVLYYPLLSMLDEWFVERRGLAYGILFGSGGIFGLVLPIAIEKLLYHYGSAITLQAYTLMIFVLIGPMLPILAGRDPNARSTSSERKIDTSVFTKVPFSAITFSNLFQGFVFFLPTMALPTYAAALGLTTSQGTLILSISNVATIIGQVGMGLLADRFDAHILMFSSTMLSAFSVLLIWGFAKGLPMLMFFGIAYGLFAGGYSVLYCRFATTLTGNANTQTWLYSIFEAQRGGVIVVGGLVSGSMVGVGEASRTQEYGIGSYKRLTVLAGIMFLVGSIGGMGWFWKGRSLGFGMLVWLVPVETGKLGDVEEV